MDTLKIDQSFVKTMDAENYAIVKTIVGLAHNLDLKVVAEGVETAHQQRLLARWPVVAQPRDSCLPNLCPQKVLALSWHPTSARHKANRPWHAVWPTPPASDLTPARESGQSTQPHLSLRIGRMQ